MTNSVTNLEARDAEANHKDCAYLIKYGLCKHPEAPRPYHSRCIGTRWCDEFKPKAETPG